MVLLQCLSDIATPAFICGWCWHVGIDTMSACIASLMINIVTEQPPSVKATGMRCRSQQDCGQQSQATDTSALL